MASAVILDQSNLDIIRLRIANDFFFLIRQKLFFDRCYDSSSIDSYLILSDLIADNYKNIPRQIGLNSGQLKACLRLLSQWHAGSAKLIHEKV